MESWELMILSGKFTIIVSFLFLGIVSFKSLADTNFNSKGIYYVIKAPLVLMAGVFLSFLISKERVEEFLIPKTKGEKEYLEAWDENKKQYIYLSYLTIIGILFTIIFLISALFN